MDIIPAPPGLPCTPGRREMAGSRLAARGRAHALLDATLQCGGRYASSGDFAAALGFGSLRGGVLDALLEGLHEIDHRGASRLWLGGDFQAFSLLLDQLFDV